MNNKVDIIIRKAEEQDGAAMMDLIKELAVYENAADEVTVPFAHFFSSGFGEKPVWWALVPEASDEDNKTKAIIGFALYYIRYSTWKGQRLYLEDIIVTEEWRGKGVGKQLMDALIDTAKDKKFSGMMWQVLDWNEPAINFYKKYKAQFDGEWVNVSIEL